MKVTNLVDYYSLTTKLDSEIIANKQMRDKLLTNAGLKDFEVFKDEAEKIADHNFEVIAPVLQEVLDNSTHVELDVSTFDCQLNGTYPIEHIKFLYPTGIELKIPGQSNVFKIQLTNDETKFNFRNTNV